MRSFILNMIFYINATALKYLNAILVNQESYWQHLFFATYEWA